MKKAATTRPAKLEATGPHTFELSGSLDFNNVATLLERAETLLLDTSPGDEISIDLSAVAHSNSAGVALLLECQRIANTYGAHLTYHNPPQQICDIASFSGLENLLSTA